MALQLPPPVVPPVVPPLVPPPEPVLVVGHQPTLGLAAAYLLSGQPQEWAIRKGAAWWLRAREREGELQVVLHAVVAPELV